MKELVEFITKLLVENYDQVQVSEVEGEQTIVIELKVAREEMGKVIGKKGITAQAIRTVLGAASVKLGKKVVLEIVE
jgi:predicted RNA-binding protein YlqC (UPF0109 family)